ncbi:DUF2157 domain-containing protein [Erythrobacter oryzae]|uniref:DUF2157 domain-containing protein n=1 Tax=Erythrobacter oryzae TaxID=3019556 RepID=UPI002553B6DF|nr:DUF2157 domain-containing protein [Erythrobacter sp. COR-2]
MSARKIAEWHAAGLIDAATRDRLAAYEAEHARPLLLWAVWGIGALAIGLGVVSVVAANWEDIPGLVRLAVHLALIAALLGLLFMREAALAERSPWIVEALVFVTAAMGLTFFGHLGQVYQTSSPIWQPLGLWLALFAPLLLLTGRSWPSALAVIGGAGWTAWEYATYMTGYGAARDPGAAWLIWLGAVVALPAAFALLGGWMRARSARPDFWRRMEQLALAYAVALGSLACALASGGAFEGSGLFAGSTGILSCAVAIALTGIAHYAARPGTSGQMAATIITEAGLAIGMAVGANDSTVPAALLFFVLWAGIAVAALHAHWRGVFQMAVGVIALRLIILSFELAGDLLMNGLGLILAGVMILGVAWGAVRVSKRFAPRAEGEA